MLMINTTEAFFSTSGCVELKRKYDPGGDMCQVYRVGVCRFQEPGSVYGLGGGGTTTWLHYITGMVRLHAAYFSQEEEAVMKEN